MDESVLEYDGPVVDILLERFGDIFFLGGGGLLVGVEGRDGCSVAGVVDGETKVAFLSVSTVVTVAVIFVVAFGPPLEDGGSGGWGTEIRVEDTASSLGVGVGKAKK